MMKAGARLAAVAAALVLCAAALARPHVAEHWALYLGDPGRPQSARLFLDPFPSAISCEFQVRTFAANGEHAFCASRRELEFGTAADETLAADFQFPFIAGRFCAPRTTPTAVASRPTHYPNVRMILGAARPNVAK